MEIRFTSQAAVARGLFVAALALCGNSIAAAWSELGHRVIARLAQENLESNAVRRVGFIVGKDAKLVDFAGWADLLVDERPETEAWHSITVPPGASKVDYKRDCPLGDCTPVKLRDCIGILRLAMKSKSERVDALKMLIGLAGDLHQPLRVGYPPGQGSEEKPVRFNDQELVLFDVWESALLERMGSEDEIVDRVRQQMTADAKAEWVLGSLRGWTWGTHQTALHNAYADLPSGDTMALDTAYIARAESAIEEQLAKAAVRLAYLLADTWP